MILTHHFEQSWTKWNKTLPPAVFSLVTQSHKTYKTSVTNCIQKLHTGHTTALFPQPSILMLRPLATSQVIYMKKSNRPSLKTHTHTQSRQKETYLTMKQCAESKIIFFPIGIFRHSKIKRFAKPFDGNLIPLNMHKVIGNTF